jgi:hypothetical protein
MKRFIYLLIGTGLALSFLGSGVISANDGNNHDVLNEIGELINGPDAKDFAEDDLLKFETALLDVIEDEEGNDSSLLAQAYLIDIYSRLAGISRTVENKEFYSIKTSITFERLIKDSPEYSLAYANYALSLSLAPDFLNLQKEAQEHFENALRHIPVNLAERKEEDWSALAITARYYLQLLDKPKLLGMTETEAQKRKSEVVEMTKTLRK